MKFGDRLKSLRMMNNLSQTDFGKILNKSANNISQYETGKREPDLETLKIISDYFKVSLDYLLGKTNDPTPIRDVYQDLHDEHDYNKELDAFLSDDEMTSMFYDYKNWTEEEKRNLLNILKGQEALRQMNKKK